MHPNAISNYEKITKLETIEQDYHISCAGCSTLEEGGGARGKESRSLQWVTKNKGRPIFQKFDYGGLSNQEKLKKYEGLACSALLQNFRIVIYNFLIKKKSCHSKIYYVPGKVIFGDFFWLAVSKKFSDNFNLSF